ncbi:hypothetical protein RFI_07158 [Reticulomyxa filosa]|uniref:Uncharacterized protein n=1 Tax=Reticulomyxa filosa TaxID=46433 RepID=X6NUI9_RETFI|nr:hypothetical protein RFI_07158 [Reticulomyxa filosa]|eukprot:ETO29965.1 hypothetical protein RFI_07158 [Reticulomyxa filosa]
MSAKAANNASNPKSVRTHQNLASEQEAGPMNELEVNEMVPLIDEHFHKSINFLDEVRCLDFSPYGDFLAAGSVDHSSKLIPLPKIFDLREVNNILASTQAQGVAAATPIPPEPDNDAPPIGTGIQIQIEPITPNIESQGNFADTK